MTQKYLSINPRRIAVYTQFDSSGGAVGQLLPNDWRLDNQRTSNDLSQKSKNRLRNTLSWLVMCSAKRNVKLSGGKFVKNFQISFVTLTLPTKQMHSHKEIKSKCLNLFLQNLRKKFKVKNYVWKAELQKNGNIHFHISFDKPIHYMIIRRYWNLAIEKLGYVTAYQKQMEQLSFDDYCYWQGQNGNKDPKKLKGSYNYGTSTSWRSPNTTDIKSVKKMDNWASYMAKYMTKDPVAKDKTGPVADSLDELIGRLWFCSTSLSRLKSCKVKFEWNHYSLLAIMKRAKRSFEVLSDWCRLIFFDPKNLPFRVRETVRDWLCMHAIKSGYEFPAHFPKFV